VTPLLVEWRLFMRLLRLKFRNSILLILIPLICAQQALGQANRIPLRYIDEWYDSRMMMVVGLGAVLGFIASVLWLPRLLARPHQDDNRRARRHAFMALVVAVLVIAGLLLLDLNMVAQFGRQTYQFKELFFDAFLSRQTFIMLGLAAVAFGIIVTLLTRLSDKFYRYMIIPK